MKNIDSLGIPTSVDNAMEKKARSMRKAFGIFSDSLNNPDSETKERYKNIPGYNNL